MSFKKLMLAAVAAVAMAASLAAQESLTQNEYLLKAAEYRDKAAAAFASGDYDAAEAFALEADKNLSLSDKFVVKVVRTDGLMKGIAKAEADLKASDAVNAKSNFPEAYRKASDALKAARAALGKEDLDSAEVSLAAAKTAITDIGSDIPLPAYYVVRLIPEKRDCFWRISGMPSIYGDPTLWRFLYEANKKKLVDPNNPDLIHPKMVFFIPSLWGEKRDGYWDPNKVYPALKKAGKPAVAK